MVVDYIVFIAGALLAIVGALGVIAARNPVHSALLLVMTLFGVAILFVAQSAHFLAVVQVIVYAGAIVVLFLFVIMLLGVDRSTDDVHLETLRGQRPAAFALGALALIELVLLSRVNLTIGKPEIAGAANGVGTNVEKVGEVVFTRHLFAFEATSVLLVIAVLGAVLLSRRPDAANAANTAEVAS